MMVLTKKQLETVDDIRLSAGLDQMNDAQFDEYCKSLDEFVQDYPTAHEEVKRSFETRDYMAFSRDLLVITKMLTTIGVSSYTQSSMELLGKFVEKKYDEAALLLNNLLTTVSTLSIDIQMAEYKDTDEDEDADSDEDTDTDTDTNTDMDAGENTNKGVVWKITPVTIPVVPVKIEERQKSILAVDDVALLLNTLKAMLADSEYKFTGVVSGNMALKYLENNTPDLFILDIEMPGINGYELAAKIRALGHKAPIIFLTGNATNDYVVKAIQAGAADFIVKPVNREYVLGKIRKFI